MKKILSVFLLLLFLLGISANAYAADMGDKDKNIALTVVYQEGGKAIAGAPVQLYKIASMDKNFHITADPTFAGFKDAIESDKTQWYILADSLTEYIKAETIAFDDETTINTSGYAMFPTEDHVLQPGVYLLYCPPYSYNGKVYYASPVIISLPNYRSDGQLSNLVTANIKFTPRGPLDLVVKKVWDNKGYPEKQPDKINVELLLDNKVVETKELNAKNAWSYTWLNLDPGDWDIREQAVSDYKETDRESEWKENTLTITITNTYQTPGGSSGSGTSGGKPPQKLPQTRQLTWPIPLMIVTGSVLLALGWWLCCDHRKGSR